jgi:hypothetical protein
MLFVIHVLEVAVRLVQSLLFVRHARELVNELVNKDFLHFLNLVPLVMVKVIRFLIVVLHAKDNQEFRNTANLS